jgi:hypothetical protein
MLDIYPHVLICLSVCPKSFFWHSICPRVALSVKRKTDNSLWIQGDILDCDIFLGMWGAPKDYMAIYGSVPLKVS